MSGKTCIENLTKKEKKRVIFYQVKTNPNPILVNDSHIICGCLYLMTSLRFFLIISFSTFFKILLCSTTNPHRFCLRERRET